MSKNRINRGYFIFPKSAFALGKFVVQYTWNWLNAPVGGLSSPQLSCFSSTSATRLYVRETLGAPGASIPCHGRALIVQVPRRDTCNRRRSRDGWSLGYPDLCQGGFEALLGALGVTGVPGFVSRGVGEGGGDRGWGSRREWYGERGSPRGKLHGGGGSFFIPFPLETWVCPAQSLLMSSSGSSSSSSPPPPIHLNLPVPCILTEPGEYHWDRASRLPPLRTLVTARCPGAILRVAEVIFLDPSGDEMSQQQPEGIPAVARYPDVRCQIGIRVCAPGCHLYGGLMRNRRSMGTLTTDIVVGVACDVSDCTSTGFSMEDFGNGITIGNGSQVDHD